MDRFISLNFLVESEGINFFTKKFTPSDTVLIHPHPIMLYDALLHTSYSKCKAVIVMHLWAGYHPYKSFLKGGHLPSFCTDRKVTRINFKAWSPVPAFSGLSNFKSVLFDVTFSGDTDLEKMLQAIGSMQGECLFGGCYLCSSEF